MVFTWQIIIATSAIACFASFVWAIKKHFAGDGKMPAGMRAISFASIVSMALQMFAVARLARIDVFPVMVGMSLYAASISIFWWAIAATRQRRLTLAFSADEPRHLQTAGPYRFVRHPFYLAYLLFWSAGLIATGEWFLILTVAAMFALYFRAARLEEAKFAASSLNEKYSNYRKQTGMFIPKIKFWHFDSKKDLTANVEETF